MADMNNMLSSMTDIINGLKKQQQTGETPFDTIKRLVGTGSPSESPSVRDPAAPAVAPTAQGAAPEPVPAPPPAAPVAPVEPASTGTPQYKFSTFPIMNTALTNKYGATWQTIIAPTPGLLSAVLGVTPNDAATQAEMHRLYASGSDEAFADHMVATPTGSKALRFNRLMIEPIV